MSDKLMLLDPTGEQAPAMRQRVVPPSTLQGLTVALFNIGKPRSDIFLSQIEKRLAELGVECRNYAKPTSGRVAPLEVLQSISSECDLVIEALAD